MAAHPSARQEQFTDDEDDEEEEGGGQEGEVGGGRRLALPDSKTEKIEPLQKPATGRNADRAAKRRKRRQGHGADDLHHDQDDDEIESGEEEDENEDFGNKPVKRTKRADAIKGRRRPWTEQEENWLREGYDRFPKQWKKILGEYPFKDWRTNVNLKDKWRNMLKNDV